MPWRVEASRPRRHNRLGRIPPANAFQAELGGCAVLLNTQSGTRLTANVWSRRWPAGCPVVPPRGGPGRAGESGLTGWLVPPDDGEAMAGAVAAAEQLNRYDCRRWVEQHCSGSGSRPGSRPWLSEGL